jgi:hypothetical protein
VRAILSAVRPRFDRRLARLAPLVLLLGLASCAGHRKLIDPTLILRGESGAQELGVSTDYGIVFLGRTVRRGELEVTAWFGDGPAVEPAVVEPIGGGLYTADTEIRLPAVGLSYTVPPPGTEVLVLSRRGWSRYETRVELARHEQVEGLLLPVRGELEGSADLVGAGVYLERDEHALTLLGLVSGRLLLETADGEREFLTVVGPEQLWRLVAHRREPPQPPRRVYRDDVL